MQTRDIRDIELDVENMGASLNAYTSRESTAYYARCLGRDVPRAMDVLGDMLMNSKLDAGAVQRERDVILREAKEARPPPALPMCPPPAQSACLVPGARREVGETGGVLRVSYGTTAAAAAACRSTA